MGAAAREGGGDVVSWDFLLVARGRGAGWGEFGAESLASDHSRERGRPVSTAGDFRNWCRRDRVSGPPESGEPAEPRTCRRNGATPKPRSPRTPSLGIVPSCGTVLRSLSLHSHPFVRPLGRAASITAVLELRRRCARRAFAGPGSTPSRDPIAPRSLGRHRPAEGPTTRPGLEGGAPHHLTAPARPPTRVQSEDDHPEREPLVGSDVRARNSATGASVLLL